MAQKLISYALLIVLMIQLSQQMPTSEPTRQSLNLTYSECHDQKSRCFGSPSGCLSNGNCDVLLSATPTSSGAHFALYWNRNSSGPDRWVSAGLSEDKHMGDDSVTECILWENNTVSNRQGLTFGRPTSYGFGVNTVEQVDGVVNDLKSFSDSLVTCSWSRTFNTTVDYLTFDILNDKYYIFLVYGPIRNGNIGKHSHVWISTEAVSLGKPISQVNTATSLPPIKTTLHS